MSTKVPLILWSGGLDSTYLVYDRLINGHPVDVLNVELENNDDIQVHEKAAMGSMAKILQADKSLAAGIRNNYTYRLNRLCASITFAQPLCWTFAYMSVLDTDKHSSIEIGYVEGDDFWHHKHDIVNYVKTIMSVHFPSPVPVEFPLEWIDKAAILRNMGSTVLGRKLLSKVRYCESVDKKACGTCASCIKHGMYADLVKKDKPIKVTEV